VACRRTDRDALLERADDSLYAAKRAGKDRVVGAGDDDSATPVRRDPAARACSTSCARRTTTRWPTARAWLRWRSTPARHGPRSRAAGGSAVAGQLHDIGKLALPDAVLNKPGPLSVDETQLVRTHSVLGAELVRAWGDPPQRASCSSTTSGSTGRATRRAWPART